MKYSAGGGRQEGAGQGCGEEMFFFYVAKLFALVPQALESFIKVCFVLGT